MIKRNTFLVLIGFLAILSGCATSVPKPASDESRGATYETGRAFLIENQSEGSDYGLYSYILFGSQPSDDYIRERYLEAISSYIDTVSTISKLETNFTKPQLNVTYLLLNRTPSPSGTSAEWLLQHYNYERARKLTDNIPPEWTSNKLRNGPYIISVLKPLTTGADSDDEFLFQDMSDVPPHLTALWIKEFKDQVAKEHFWKKDMMKEFALLLRKKIGALSEGLPDIVSNMKKYIHTAEVKK